MMDQLSAVEAYTTALMKADDHAVETAAPFLADEVVVLTNFGAADGKEAALPLLKNPMVATFLADAEWSEPKVNADTVTLQATIPSTMPFGGLDCLFVFGGDGTITRVEQQMLPPAPLEPSELRLSDELKDLINSAFDNNAPVIVAYVDDDQQPHLSFRGTTQAYSDDQLALWARDPDSGMARAIPDHPKVTFLYRDPKAGMTYNLYGRARVVTDEAARKAIFENANPIEQHIDFRRAGVAIVAELDKVEGRGLGGRVLMVRTQASPGGST